MLLDNINIVLFLTMTT